MVWWWEMLHCLRDRVGTRVSLLQSLMFLFLLVLGAGLGGLVAGSGMGSALAYLAFLFPGVLVIAAQPAAISVGASIVWEREDGFLREMLVAPVLRVTLLIGKCLGGATVATCEGVLIRDDGPAGDPRTKRRSRHPCPLCRAGRLAAVRRHGTVRTPMAPARDHSIPPRFPLKQTIGK